MLVVKVNQLDFEYDIYSLVKAFFSQKEIKILPISEIEDSDNNDENKENQIEISIFIGANYIRVKIQDSLECFLEKKIELDQEEDRPKLKNKLKQVMYQCLSEYSKKTLPWGTLTGIRPTKIPMAMLENGMNRSEILQNLQDTYMISPKKGNLSIDIVEREHKLLSLIHNEKGYSVYIGIPFCPTTCLYCSFTSYPICGYQNKVEAYLDAVGKELDFIANNYQHKILDTIYIGGGTPTTLSCFELELLMKRVTTTLNLNNILEFTVEAGRADSITKEKLQVLMKYGVTRISVNPQTMKEETLHLIGRNHTINQVKEAFFLAREVGFTNINMDIILGLPNESEEDVIHTIDEIIKLGPDSLTVHSLAIKRASKLQEWMNEHQVDILTNTEEMMEIVARGASALGMKPYYLYRQKNMAGNLENIGYATPNKYGIYNIVIMEEKQDIIAVGAGAASKKVRRDKRVERCECVKDVDIYIDRIDEMIERKRKLFIDQVE